MNPAFSVANTYLMRAKPLFFLAKHRIWIEWYTSVRRWLFQKRTSFIENEFLISWNQMGFQVHMNRSQCSHRRLLHSPPLSIWILSRKVNFSFYCHFFKPLAHSHSLKKQKSSLFDSVKKKIPNHFELSQWISFFFPFFWHQPVVAIALSTWYSSRFQIYTNRLSCFKFAIERKNGNVEPVIAQVHRVPCLMHTAHTSPYPTAPTIPVHAIWIWIIKK